jgi:hypothetical protein
VATLIETWLANGGPAGEKIAYNAAVDDDHHGFAEDHDDDIAVAAASLSSSAARGTAFLLPDPSVVMPGRVVPGGRRPP